MSFVQIEFPILVAITLALYHLTPSLRIQNFILLIASCIFYGWWNSAFLVLMLVESAVVYAGARLIERNIFPKLTLYSAMLFLIGMLAYFKYMNFFINSFRDMMGIFGYVKAPLTLDVILPIGISFHTFQAIAYLIDVRRGIILPEKDVVRFAAFSVFFPQLVAGPIERASHLLTQFQNARTVNANKIQQAVWLIIIGLFFKIAIADTLAPMADVGFSDTTPPVSAWWIILSALAFTLQIYGDFMGYSLIARGIAMLFGIELSWNFLFPYWSRSISEFWHRWHVTLGYWLRDYLYIPLGGSHCSRSRAALNLMVTMLLGGLWHGANWTFVLWGAWHGGALAVYHTLLKDRLPPGRFRVIAGWLTTMTVVIFGWVLFRVNSPGQLVKMVQAFQFWAWYPAHTDTVIALAFSSAVIMGLEWIQRSAPNHDSSSAIARPWRAIILGLALVCAGVMSMHTRITFIYFQF